MVAGPAIEVDLLGPLVVRVEGVQTPLAGFKPRAILAMLAVQAPHPVTTDTLIEVLHGQQPSTRALVHTYVRRLRAALGAEAVVTVADGYRLGVEPDRIDLHRFRALVAAAGPAQGRRDRLHAALALWRGTPFVGLRCDILDRDVAPGLVEELLSALERRVDADLAAGSIEPLTAELRELTAAHPLRESLWLRLMVTLQRDDRAAEALECYAALRRRLADELGADPGDALQRAHQALLTGEPIPPPGAVDPPTASVPRQLPYDVADFLARGEELGQLDALLAGPISGSGGTTIVSLTGPPGVGKTALAVHWAHRAGPVFSDGTLYADLHGFGPGPPAPPGAVLELFLRALAVPTGLIPADEAGRGALLRSTLAERRVLLVLDNARDADQVRALLPGAGGRVLVTSRDQLTGLSARDGAHRIAVGGLDTSRCLELLAIGGGRQVRAEPETGRQLAELCGHLPLPLRVLGERLGRDRELPLADVLAELRERRGGLDAFPDDDRASDLRAVFSWSYQALPDEPARVFRLLGACPAADVGPEAAAALTGLTVPRVRRTLDRLVAASLVQQRGRARFGLHDLLRAYAAELADQRPAQTAAALDRLTEWCIHAATDAEQALEIAVWEDLVEPRTTDLPLPHFTNAADRFSWFAADRPLLLAMFEAVRTAGDDRAVSRLGRPLARLLWGNQRWIEQETVAAALNGAAARLRRPDYEVAAVLGLLIAASMIRSHDQAVRQHGPALLDAARRSGDQRLVMVANGAVGLTLSLAGDTAAALDPVTVALDIARQHDQPRYVARYQTYLANIRVKLDQPELALDLLQEAAALETRLGDRTTNTMGMTCRVLRELGRAEEAIRRYPDAIQSAQQHGQRDMHADLLIGLGEAYVDADRTAEAQRAWRQSLTIFTELGDRRAATVAALLSQLERSASTD